MTTESSIHYMTLYLLHKIQDYTFFLKTSSSLRNLNLPIFLFLPQTLGNSEAKLMPGDSKYMGLHGQITNLCP